jgi:RecJ-like exonuclease
MKKICLTISLLGILILLIIVNYYEPSPIEINKISQKNINYLVKINGKITEINIYKSNFTKLTISQKNDSITAICNCPNLQKNKDIEILGRVEEYENKIQINVDKIILINK